MILVLRATTIIQIIPASTGIVEWRELLFQIWLNSDPGTLASDAEGGERCMHFGLLDTAYSLEKKTSNSGL